MKDFQNSSNRDVSSNDGDEHVSELFLVRTRTRTLSLSVQLTTYHRRYDSPESLTAKGLTRQNRVMRFVMQNIIG